MAGEGISFEIPIEKTPNLGNNISVDIFLLGIFTLKMCDTKVSRAHPDTSSSYLRKIKKPLIERKRRERINNCLDQLKAILLENIKRNGGTQVSKLDKADILEMTVSHLRQIQHQQISVAMSTSASAINQYRQGYTECADETARFMETTQAYPSDMAGRVRSHLSHSTPALPTRNVYENKLYLHGIHEQTSPIKSDPTRMCKSVSPRSDFMNYSQMYSTLLMPVPHVKQESFSDSESDYVSCDVRDNDAHKSPRSVSANQPSVSPSQKQVWRPF